MRGPGPTDPLSEDPQGPRTIKYGLRMSSFTVPELDPVQVPDRAPDPEHHRVGRRGVPLAGRPQPRVDVGEALGDLQELQGAPGLNQFGLALDRVDKGLGLCVEV